MRTKIMGNSQSRCHDIAIEYNGLVVERFLFEVYFHYRN